jgi:hypothetical protein
MKFPLDHSNDKLGSLIRDQRNDNNKFQIQAQIFKELVRCQRLVTQEVFNGIND